MIIGRFTTRLPSIRQCWHAHPRTHLPVSLRAVRFASDIPRRPRNDEIKYKFVRFVDPETGELQPPGPLQPILDTIKAKTHFLELVAEKPEPVVRLISRKARHEKEKEMKKRRLDAKKEEKEIQLTWGVALGDLGHKLKKVREELAKGNRVSLVFAPRKGQPPLSVDQMAARVEEAVDALADVGKEWKAPNVQKHTTAIHLQGIPTASNSP